LYVGGVKHGPGWDNRAINPLISIA